MKASNGNLFFGRKERKVSIMIDEGKKKEKSSAEKGGVEVLYSRRRS